LQFLSIQRSCEFLIEESYKDSLLVISHVFWNNPTLGMLVDYTQKIENIVINLTLIAINYNNINDLLYNYLLASFPFIPRLHKIISRLLTNTLLQGLRCTVLTSVTYTRTPGFYWQVYAELLGMASSSCGMEPRSLRCWWTSAFNYWPCAIKSSSPIDK